MREKIELHDSILESVLMEEDRVVVTLNAYIHRSAGEPGVAPGIAKEYDPGQGYLRRPINLQLHFFEHPPVAIAGTGLTITREGEPEFLETVDFDQ